MSILESITLGAIQGLTEFIPISSSGHLVIAQSFLGGASDHKFLEWINLGTLLALLIFFRSKIVNIIKDIVQNHNYILLRNVILTSIPAGIVGLALSNFIDREPFFSSVVTVAFTLAIVGIIMIILEKLPKASHIDGPEKLSPVRATMIGVAQMFALIPGVSRSGSTIIAGRLSGLNSRDAAEYSFLASIPIMLAVCLKLFASGEERAYLFANFIPLSIANLVALITGLLAVGFLIRYLTKHGLALFGWYRVGLALILALYLVLR